MKTSNPIHQKAANFMAAVLSCLAVCAASSAFAANSTWSGAGNDGKWQTPNNWQGGSPPNAGDALIFTGSTRLNNTNNFTAGSAFNGLTFSSPASAFNLFGNSILLTNDIVDGQFGVNETVTLPLALDATHNMNVANNGTLTLNGNVSGAAGVTKTGGGTLVLGVSNSFSGVLTVSAGTVSVSADNNFGAVPGAPTAGKIVIADGATLLAATNLAINSNRGVSLTSGGGGGGSIISVPSAGRVNLANYTINGYTGANTLTNGGTISDSGAGNGIVKRGFGGVVLSGSNAYSGATVVKVGTLRLDYAAAGAPTNNIIKTNSTLTIGGDNNGAGSQSFAALVMTGKNGATNSQSFSNATFNVGAAYIRVNSGANGAARLDLNAVNHIPGAHVEFINPTNGFIHTTSTNIAGILGGWATYATNTTPLQNSTIIPPNTFATVDGNGNIQPYSGYAVYTAANDGANVMVNSAAFTNQNVMMIGAAHSPISMQIDTSGAGTTTDVNTISTFGANANGDTIYIGAGNTLRLGKFGCIFRQNIGDAVNAYVGGISDVAQSGSGTAASQSVGTLTAGGGTNQPGEILLLVNNNAANQNTGRLIVEANITDNGTGVVTLVKSGIMGIKLDGHNSYSGGTYVLQSYLQIAGTDVGVANPDGVGSGPVYIFPGAQFFASGAVYTNAFYFAGIGTDQENFGCVRGTTGTTFTQPTTLIGDARFGARGASGGGMYFINQITDSGLGFAATFGDGGATGNIMISNITANANNWAGGTIAGFGILRIGLDEQIPDGLGKGDLQLNSSATAANNSIFDLNGHNETVNGLSVIGSTANNNIFVENESALATSTLTVGNNDASATFRGVLRDNGGVLALTKIGGGTETLSGANSLSGLTTVLNGTLALSGAASYSSTAVQVSGTNGVATFDISASPGISFSGTVGLTNGALAVNTATLPTFAVTNSHIRATLDPAKINVSGVTALTIDGTTNFIDISSIVNVTAYPTQFTVVKYSGAIAGAGFNFGLGTLPTATTTGYVSNNVANSSIDVYLSNGPKQLNWQGGANTNWDIATTANWKFGAASTVYNDQDSVVFVDGATTGNVTLTTTLTPTAVTFTNASLNYTLSGPGKITGFGAWSQTGAATVTLAGSGGDDFKGGMSVSGGKLVIAETNSISGGLTIGTATVQLNLGNLPGGTVINEGTLLFGGNGDLSANNIITGSSGGAVIKTNTGALTLSGPSTYDAQTTVNFGTLIAGTGGAANGSSGPFGSSVGATVLTNNNNVTLDVNGQNLGIEPVLVSGAGVGGVGAIINSGAAQQNALINVTLAGDTTFGGGFRWDIRGTGAILSTGGNGYNLTKIGTNQVSLVGVNVDSALSNIVVNAGILGIETSTTLGETVNSKLTVAAGAAIQFFNNTLSVLKPLVLNGDGASSTVINNAGATIIQSKTLLNSGNCVFNVGGTSLTINDDGFADPLGGAGGLVKSGGALLDVTIPMTYAGATVVSNGTFAVDAPLLGTSGVTVAGGTLAGLGPVGRPVSIQSGGRISPNGAGSIVTFVLSNTLALGGNCAMDVDKTSSVITSDLITNITTLTIGGTLTVNFTSGDSSTLTNGDIIPLFGATAKSGTFATIVPATPGSGLAWDQSQLAVDGTLRVITASSTPAVFTGVSLSGANLNLSGTNGSPGAPFVVLCTTNLILPVTNWTAIVTQNFSGTGTFNLVLTNVVNSPQQFYRLSQ